MFDEFERRHHIGLADRDPRYAVKWIERSGVEALFGQTFSQQPFTTSVVDQVARGQNCAKPCGKLSGTLAEERLVAQMIFIVIDIRSVGFCRPRLHFRKIAEATLHALVQIEPANVFRKKSASGEIVAARHIEFFLQDCSGGATTDLTRHEKATPPLIPGGWYRMDRANCDGDQTYHHLEIVRIFVNRSL